MARIENHKYSIEEAFRECFYIVPDYQREYVWTDKEVHQLLEDIGAQIDAGKASRLTRPTPAVRARSSSEVMLLSQPSPFDATRAALSAVVTTMTLLGRSLLACSHANRCFSPSSPDLIEAIALGRLEVGVSQLLRGRMSPSWMAQREALTAVSR
jgi:hypothetical protein